MKGRSVIKRGRNLFAKGKLLLKYAKDLMSPKPVVCQVTESLEHLLNLFLNSNFKYIPVVDTHGNAIGWMDELQLVKALSDKHLDPSTTAVQAVQRLLLPVHFIDATAPIGEILPTMLKAQAHRLVVVSGSKKPIGILSPLNILRAVVGLKPHNRKIEKQLEELKEKAESSPSTQNSQDIFFQAFAASPYMMILLDPEALILQTNDLSQQLLEYSADELLGKNFTDLFPDFARRQIQQALFTARQNGKCPTRPTAVLRKHGKYLDVDMAVSGIRGSDRRLLYFSVILRSRTSEDLQMEYVRS